MREKIALVILLVIGGTWFYFGVGVYMAGTADVKAADERERHLTELQCKKSRVSSVEIVSLNSAPVSEGSISGGGIGVFFLGIGGFKTEVDGSFTQKPFYFYYEKLEDGGLKLQQIDAATVVIHEREETRAYLETTQEYTGLVKVGSWATEKPYRCKFGTPTHKFLVPKGTVIREFKL